MKKNIKAILAVILLFAIVIYGVTERQKISPATTSSGDDRVITIGASPTAYPVLYMEGAEVKGSFYDFAEAIGNKAGYKIEWEIGEWSGILASLQGNRIDSAANFAKTPEREEMYQFTNPIIYSSSAIGVAPDNTEIQGVEDLKGKTVNTILGSNYGAALEALDTNNEINIEPIEDINVAFNNVRQGKVDAVVYGYELLTSLNQNRSANLRILDNVFGVNEVAFPLARNSEKDQVMADWNQAIEELRADGTLKEISEKWYDTDITENPVE